MVVEWTAHRFSGGILAFDLVNTVVCRSQPVKRIDRFEDLDAISDFAVAASGALKGGVDVATIGMPLSALECIHLLGLREAIDGYFRQAVITGKARNGTLSDLFAAAAAVSKVSGEQGFGTRVAVSAMKLLDDKLLSRAKICPNCDWLFLDKSKNKSRLWCDMAVCGNRAKAKRHYAASRDARGAV